MTATQCATDNPYWEAVRHYLAPAMFGGGNLEVDWLSSHGRMRQDGMRSRQEYCGEYAWTVTDPLAIAFVARHATRIVDPMAGTGYQSAGQCSGLQPGGEGPRWEGRQGPSSALTRAGRSTSTTGDERFGDEHGQGGIEADPHLGREVADGGVDVGGEPNRCGLL